MTERPEKSTRLPSKFWRKRPCLPLIISLKDLSGRLFAPFTAFARRPLSKSASTASWSILFSLRMIISGASSSISLFKRVLRLITRRYKSLTSLTANLPPSSATKGRKSGGKTGKFVIIIHSGRFGVESSISPELLFKKFSTTFKRLMMLFFLASLFVAFISLLSWLKRLTRSKFASKS